MFQWFCADFEKGYNWKWCLQGPSLWILVWKEVKGWSLFQGHDWDFCLRDNARLYWSGLESGLNRSHLCRGDGWISVQGGGCLRGKSQWRVQHWGQNPVGSTQQVTVDGLQRSYMESMSRNRTEECHGRQGNWVRLQECKEGGGREMDLRLWRQISGSQAVCLAGIFGFFMSAFDLTVNVTEIFPFFWQSGCPQTLQLLREGSFVTRMVANISMTLYSCLGPGCLDCICHLP